MDRTPKKLQSRLGFDYTLDYQNLDFTDSKTRKLYRVGKGEQGVLLVKPYTKEICKHWRFKTPAIAKTSAVKIYRMFLEYRNQSDFIGMDMCRKFLEMGFTRSRRYANHRNGRKYDKNGKELPQEKDALTCDKAKSAAIFKKYRDLANQDKEYQKLKNNWLCFIN